MSRTKIAWADSTINPVVGCSKISAGCQNCYAEEMARRLSTMEKKPLPQYRSVISFGRWNGLTAFVPSELEKPYKWRKPRSIFVSSMGDLFHESVDIKWQLAVMDMIYGCPQHTFILLTKRPEYMQMVVTARIKQDTEILPNLICGVSVEDQQTADERIPVLRKIPSAKIFVSLEPMIGPVDLGLTCIRCGHLTDAECPGSDYACRMIRPIDGVILGGESGNKGRRLDPRWVMSVRDQCKYAGVPFMFKQWNHENRNEVDETTGFPWLGSRTHSDLAW